MEQQCGRAVPRSAQQAGEAFQIYRYALPLLLSGKTTIDCTWVFFVFFKKTVFCTVNCIIMQKNGAGLQTASSCFWDNSTDGKENANSTYTPFQMSGESSGKCLLDIGGTTLPQTAKCCSVTEFMYFTLQEIVQ